MQLKTTRFLAPSGWAAPLPTAMDGPRTLVLAFGASAFAEQPQPFAELRAAFPQAVLLGCSTAGEVIGSQVHDDSIGVAVARFAHTELRHAATELQGPHDCRPAGARLAHQLQAPGLRAVFLLGDGLHVSGSALLVGLAQNLADDVHVCGGLAGDGERFARTWVLDGGAPAQRRIAAVGLYGAHLRIGHGRDGGWSSFSPGQRITRAEGRVLYELDGRPALDLLQEYLGEHAAGLPAAALRHPLALERAPGTEPVLRTIVGIDRQQRSMTFADDMPPGGTARLMRTGSDELIDSAGRAAARATQGLGRHDGPLLISISCAGRRLVLGARAGEEFATVADGAPCRAAQVGFYAYGAIARGPGGGAGELHNQTMTVTAISESAPRTPA